MVPQLDVPQVTGITLIRMLKKIPLLTLGLMLWMVLIFGTQAAIGILSRSERDDELLRSIQVGDVGKQAAEVCAACHDLSSRNSGVGPHLVGIVGRRAGAVSDFQYSDALRSGSFVWSRDRLREFLLNPSTTLPGTAMAISGVPESEVDALIDYLDGQL